MQRVDRGADRAGLGRRRQAGCDRQRDASGFLDPSLRLKNPRLRRVTVQVLPARSSVRCATSPVHLRNLGDESDRAGGPAAVEVMLRGSRQGLSRVDRDGRERLCRSRGARCRRVRARRQGRRLAGSGRRAHRACDRPGARSSVPKTERAVRTDGVRGTAGRYPLDPPPSGASARRSCARCRIAGTRRGCSSAATRASRAAGSKRSSRTAPPARARRSRASGVVPTPAVAYLTRTAGLRRRRRDLRLAQPVRGQRHQGVLRTRREVHRARRAGGRGDRRRQLLAGARRGGRRRAACRSREGLSRSPAGRPAGPRSPSRG